MAEKQVPGNPKCLKTSHCLVGKFQCDPNAGEKLRELRSLIYRARKELLDQVYDRLDEVMLAANPAQRPGEVSDPVFLHTDAYRIARNGLDQAAGGLDAICLALDVAERAHRQAVRAGEKG